MEKCRMKPGGIKIALLLAGLLLASCKEQSVSLESQSSDGSQNGTGSISKSQICHDEDIDQSTDETVDKLDILIVSDTSGSLNQERTRAARQIRSLLEQIPSNIDVRVGIIPGHGSRGSSSGRLWKYRNEPLVLKTSELSMSDIGRSLESSLTHMQGDLFSDGGEEGLFSLNRALDEGKKQAIQAHGLLREDAGLSVIFISDENDICYQYKPGETRVPDPQHLEDFAYRLDCGSISPEGVYDRLRAFSGDRPLTISGILYTNQETLRRGGENEMGHGYLDLISLAGGTAIDLGSLDYSRGLSDLGGHIHRELRLKRHLHLTSEHSIDLSTLTVKVDGHDVDFSIKGKKISLLRNRDDRVARNDERHGGHIHRCERHQDHHSNNELDQDDESDHDLGSEGSQITVHYCEVDPGTTTPPPSTGGGTTDPGTTTPPPSTGGGTTDPGTTTPPPSTGGGTTDPGATTPPPSTGGGTTDPGATTPPPSTGGGTTDPGTTTPPPVVVLPPGAVDNNQDGIDDNTGYPIF